MIADDVRREVAAKLREASTGAYRHVDSLVVTSEAFPLDWYSCPVCGAVVLDEAH